jgi:branched-chain amino acid transport system substrate-binding protein
MCVFLRFAAGVFLASTFLLTSAAAAAEGRKPKIGVSVPLSGEAAFQGEDVKNAVMIANRELTNDAYQLVFEDDKCSGKEAVSAARKLVDTQQVRYVLGFPCSGALLPASAVYQQAGVVVISSVAMASAISQAGDCIFRTCPNNVGMARALFDYVSARHRRIGIISEETEYPQSLAREFMALARQTGLQVEAVSYLPDTVDFRSMLLRLKRGEIEALFVNPQAEPAFVRILKQMSEMNWKPQVYGNLYPSSPTFLKLAGGLAEGVIFSDLPFVEGTLTEEGRRLYGKFLAKFGPPVSSDFSVVTTFAAFAALHEAIQSGQDVKEHLYRHKFGRVVESYSFDQNGDVVGIEPVMKRIRHGAALPAAGK